MTAINGHAGASANSQADAARESVSTAVMFGAPAGAQLTPEMIKEFVAELEVPFTPSVIEWRITNTTKANGPLRGQVIPYADQRAYTDRLNALFSPAGWTRKYTVHTSANFQRNNDDKVVAKVFVTCELTIFGLGSHSATGEGWADDDNAGTAAEAQAFKRACSCFGLGRYLYYFTGTWVDLDERKRPTTTPQLAGWATPHGWREGLRPQPSDNRMPDAGSSPKSPKKTLIQQKQNASQGERDEVTRQIEAMAEPLGKGLYRGLLKTLARVWTPKEVHDAALLQKVLVHMQSANRGLRRLEAALQQTGPKALTPILRSHDFNSVSQINTLEALHEIVVALETKMECGLRE